MGQDASRLKSHSPSSSPAHTRPPSPSRRSSSSSNGLTPSSSSKRASPQPSAAARERQQQQQNQHSVKSSSVSSSSTPTSSTTAGVMPKSAPIKINDVHKQDLAAIPEHGRRIMYERKESLPKNESTKKQPPSGESVSAAVKKPKYQCWRLSVPVAKFASTVPNSDAKLLRAQDVTMHFPVFDKYFAVKKFRNRGPLTEAKLLALVQRMAIIALAFYLKDKHYANTGRRLDRDITYGEVHPLLEKHVTCSLVVLPARPGYNVYVL